LPRHERWEKPDATRKVRVARSAGKEPQTRRKKAYRATVATASSTRLPTIRVVYETPNR
jgi:hypothetical protein